MLRAAGGKDVARHVRGLVQSTSISADGRRQLLELLARVGTAKDLSTVFTKRPTRSTTPAVTSDNRSRSSPRAVGRRSQRLVGADGE